MKYLVFLASFLGIKGLLLRTTFVDAFLRPGSFLLRLTSSFFVCMVILMEMAMANAASTDSFFLLFQRWSHRQFQSRNQKQPDNTDVSVEVL